MFANFDWIGAMRSSPVMVIILLCSVVTLGFALDQVHRCQAWWRDLQVRKMLRRWRTKWWIVDWLADRAIRGAGLGRLLTCA